VTAPAPAEPESQTAPADEVTSDLTAAQNAIEVAANLAPSAPPVPVASAHPLDSGLVDYGMWVEMFAHADPPAASGPIRRGRIWA
jgi:cyanobactin cluster PatC/TenC/TruC protein